MRWIHGGRAAAGAEKRALGLVRRYLRTRDPDLLETALTEWEQAVRWTSAADRQNLGRRLVSLAETMRVRFDAHGDVDDLEAAIVRGREAVEATDLTAPGASDIVRNLARSYVVAFGHSQDPEHLRLAQETTEQAYKVAVPRSPAQLDLSSDLVEMLARRSQATRDPLLLEEAVQIADRGTHRALGDGPWDVRALKNAAVVHGMRFALYDDPEDLVQQVGMVRSALAKVPDGGPERTGLLIQLGAALRNEVGDADTAKRAHALQEGISVSQQAVQLARIEKGSIERGSTSARRAARTQLAQALDTLGSALAKRASLDASDEARQAAGTDLDDAVDLSAEARGLVEAGSPEWATVSDNLAQDLLDRYRSRASDKDLTGAEHIWRDVLLENAAVTPSMLSGLADILRHRVALSGSAGEPREDRLQEAAQLYARARSMLEAHLEEVPVTQRLARERRRRDLVWRETAVLLELGRTYDALLVAEQGKAGLLAAALRRLPVTDVSGVPHELLENERTILAAVDGQESMQLLAETTPQVSVLLDGMAIRMSEGPVLVPAQSSRRAKVSLRRAQEQALRRVWDQIEACGEQGRRHVEFRRGAPLESSALREALHEHGAGTAVLALTIASRASATPGQVDGVRDVALLALESAVAEPVLVWTGLDESLATDMADRLRSEVAGHNPATPRLQTWHRRLQRPLQEVADRMGRPARLLVSSTAALPGVPWPALLASAGWQQPATPFPVSMVPSLAIVAQTARRQPVRELPVRVIGDPDETLPHGREEAEQVARTWHTDSILGAKATEAEVTRALEQASLVHLACHAYYDEDNPLMSGVQMSDGDVKAHELLDAQTDVHALVLSACDTGRSADLPGDQAIGLATVLLRCGVRSLVVSLWEVQDEATAVLMSTFHGAVRQGARLDDALGAASAAVASHERWSHPYYWSAFTLVGDASPLVLSGGTPGPE